MDKETQKGSARVLANLDSLLGDLESVYKDLHAHPELSMQENRTAQIAADRLRASSYEVTTGVGKTGVVGLLRNGDGPTIMLRADMDALPVKEATELPVLCHRLEERFELQPETEFDRRLRADRIGAHRSSWSSRQENRSPGRILQTLRRRGRPLSPI